MLTQMKLSRLYKQMTQIQKIFNFNVDDQSKHIMVTFVVIFTFFCNISIIRYKKTNI